MARNGTTTEDYKRSRYRQIQIWKDTRDMIEQAMLKEGARDGKQVRLVDFIDRAVREYVSKHRLIPSKKARSRR